MNAISYIFHYECVKATRLLKLFLSVSLYKEQTSKFFFLCVYELFHNVSKWKPYQSDWNAIEFAGGPVFRTPPSYTYGGVGSIPGRGTKIPHDSRPKKKKPQNIKQKQYWSKFNEKLKNGPD